MINQYNSPDSETTDISTGFVPVVTTVNGFHSNSCYNKGRGCFRISIFNTGNMILFIYP